MLKIEKRIIEQIRIKSHSTSELLDKTKELRNKGFMFEPIKSYQDENYQDVCYTIGTKEITKKEIENENI